MSDVLKKNLRLFSIISRSACRRHDSLDILPSGVLLKFHYLRRREQEQKRLLNLLCACADE